MDARVEGAVVRIDDFQPMWLDPNGRCLYAGIHGVSQSARETTGVVLVPPLLHELPASRRFLTEVAAGLAAQGLPSLRFDFFGTGDSSGMGHEVDFASMFADLDLVVAAIGEQAGVDRVVLLVWRGASLPVAAWLEQGGWADMVVLWEPITDGSAWLLELEREDANERLERSGSRPGINCLGVAADGQLMGFPVSPSLRRDLAQVRLEGDALGKLVPAWAVVRPEAADMPLRTSRTLLLPEGAPSFQGGASMDSMFFLTPPVRRLVEQLGQALREPWL